MLHVLTIAIDYLPNLGGISNHIYHLHHGLLKRGIHSTILQIVQNSPGTGCRVVKEDENHYRWYIDGRISRIGAYRRRLQLKQIIREMFPCVNIIHTHEIGNTEMLLPLSGVKWVWTNHTSRFFDVFHRDRSALSCLRKALYRNKFQNANGIVSVSSQLHDISTKIAGRARTAFIPNGVDLNLYANPMRQGRDLVEIFHVPRGKYTILIPARWSHVKGVHLVPAMLELLSTAYPMVYRDLHIVFVGAGLGEPDYRETIITSVAAHRTCTTIIDRVEYDQMAHLYLNADLTLIPSLHENTSIAILEAMASNSVVLASAVGGTVDLIDDGINGFLFESGNVVDAVQKIVSIFNMQQESSHLLLKVREKALRNVHSRYSIDAVCDAVVDFYRQLAT